MPQRGAAVAAGDSGVEAAEDSAAASAAEDSAAVSEAAMVGSEEALAVFAVAFSLARHSALGSTIRFGTTHSGGRLGPIRGHTLGLTPTHPWLLDTRRVTPRRSRMAALRHSNIGIAAAILRAIIPIFATAIPAGNKSRQPRRPRQRRRVRRLRRGRSRSVPPRQMQKRGGISRYGLRRLCSSSRGMISMKLQGLWR